MSEHNGKIFTPFDGLPTAPDVKLLVERYGVPEPGLIPHAEISALIGIPWPSARYTTVTNVWRNKLEQESNLLMRVEPGLGIRILDDRERAPFLKHRTFGIVRATRKTAIRARNIPTEKLEPRDQAEALHLQTHIAMMYTAMQNGAKALQPPKPPPQLPRAQA